MTTQTYTDTIAAMALIIKEGHSFLKMLTNTIHLSDELADADKAKLIETIAEAQKITADIE